MARSRLRGTLVDYLVAAIEPALIMVMVGSLMFFLLDMWYAGEFLERLRWILFWFVLGIVLITRVSMRIGSSLAKAYGIALGGAVALVASRLAGFQPVLLVILGIVWWVTHKLTYDCTLLDEDQDAGTWPVAGERARSVGPGGRWPTAARRLTIPRRWTRRSCHKPRQGEERQRERRRGTPAECARGLADLFHARVTPPFRPGPVAGAGGRRRAARWVVRVLSRLYFQRDGPAAGDELPQSQALLRQRKLKMPAAMTATWLSTGAIMIIGLTVLAAALPLPGTGWSVVRGSTAASSDLRASRAAVLRDGGVKGEGAGGEKNDPSAKQQTAGKGKGGGKSGPGNAKTGTARQGLKVGRCRQKRIAKARPGRN